MASREIPLISIDFSSATDKQHQCHIQRIMKSFTFGKRIVFVTGAGISVSAGIPDFRSKGGLYDLVREKYESSAKGSSVKLLRGQDFFDASFFHNVHTRSFFYQFIGELKSMCDSAHPTPTHSFIKDLICKGNVIRWYSQNIDCIESDIGLTTSSGIDYHSSPNVVTLHGSLSRLVCTICKSIFEFTREHTNLFKDGIIPNCKTCGLKAEERKKGGKRSITVGFLRPDIVLYNEHHPQGEHIAQCISEDMRKKPTVLIVMGTSLRVAGLKKLVKDFAKHARLNSSASLLIYINKTPLQSVEWKRLFDYELIGSADDWCSFLSSEMPSTIPPESPITTTISVHSSTVKITSKTQTDMRSFVSASKGTMITSVKTSHK